MSATVAAYDAHADAYAAASPASDEAVRARLAGFAARVGAGGHVLEIGSAQGRDALALERLGLAVHRTDVAPAFVARLRAEGHAASLLDPLTDDLRRDVLLGPGADDGRGGRDGWDGVWAQACLLHVDREDLPVVLRRLADVVRPGGALFVSVKEGDGEAWSTHGAVAAPRRFVYWRAGALRDVLEAAGWDHVACERSAGSRGETWVTTIANRAEGR